MAALTKSVYFIGVILCTLITDATSIHTPESSVVNNNPVPRVAPANNLHTADANINNVDNNDGSATQSVANKVDNNNDGNIVQIRQQLVHQFASDMAKIQSLPMSKLTTPCHLISFDRSNTKAWTLDDWDEHCVSPLRRYAKHVCSWPFSTTMYRVVPMVLLVLSWSAIILFASYYSSPAISKLILQSSLSYGLIGPFLSPIALLLSLRANQALARLNEVRRAWGLMGKSIRSLTGLIATYGVFAVHGNETSGSDDKDTKSAKIASMEASLLVAKYLAIFGWSMKATFRKDEDDTTIIRTVLPLTEAAWLLSLPVKRPIAILSRVRNLIQYLATNTSNTISPMMHLTLEQRLYDLEASFGICNRILMSPIPPTYTRHTSRVLCLFLFLLPLNFAGSKMTPSALLMSVMTISYVLVGIDEIGLEIAHPFPLLPMQAMASTYQKNVENQFMLLASMNSIGSAF